MPGLNRAAVWPFAALFGVSGLFLVGYSAADPSPWLGRMAVTVCGTNPSASHALLLGLVLLTLAHGLSRRRRVDWVLGLGLVVWSVLTEAESLATRTPGEPWRLVPLLLALVSLIRSRERFPVEPDPHRLRQTAAVAGAGSATLLLLGGGGLFAERGRFAAPLSTPRDLGRQFLAAVAGNTGGVDFDGPAWLLPGLALASGLALIAVLGWLSAAAPPPEPADSADRAAMRELIAHEDADTLAPFALRYDKTYAFEPHGRAAIGYRVLAGMAVVGGDPIGARSAWPDAIDAFLAESERRGWRPAVLGAGPEARELWAARGMRGFGIGDEVVIDVENFSLSGRQMRNVRQAVQRTEHAGIWVAVIPERELSEELAAQLRRIHRAWLGRGTARRPRPDADEVPQGREHGFAMNLDAMAEGRHPDSLLTVAFAADGYAVAFQRYLVAGDAGPEPALSLDVMPRHRVAPNGVNERLIVATIEYAAEHGFKTVSLNFAAFRTILEAYRLGSNNACTAATTGSGSAATPATGAPGTDADGDRTGGDRTNGTGGAPARTHKRHLGRDQGRTRGQAHGQAQIQGHVQSQDLGLVTKLTHRAIHMLDPLIQVESLYRFNAKFRPGWLPRAVLVASWLDLPLFGLAAFGLEFALPYDRRRSRIGTIRPTHARHSEAPQPESASDPSSSPSAVGVGADQAN